MSENLRRNIAKNISELRRQKGLTQSEFGEKLSFSDKTISKWENADSTPDIEVLSDIAQFFGVSIDDLTKENAIEKSSEEFYKREKDEFRNKLLIMFLSIIFVLLAATIVFVSLTIVKNVYLWKIFVWATPVIAIILYRYNRRELKIKTLSIIFSSIIVWTILVCIYVQLLKYNLWQVFLLGTPLQAIIIVSSFLKNYK